MVDSNEIYHENELNLNIKNSPQHKTICKLSGN